MAVKVVLPIVPVESKIRSFCQHPYASITSTLSTVNRVLPARTRPNYPLAVNATVALLCSARVDTSLNSTLATAGLLSAAASTIGAVEQRGSVVRVYTPQEPYSNPLPHWLRRTKVFTVGYGGSLLSNDDGGHGGKVGKRSGESVVAGRGLLLFDKQLGWLNRGSKWVIEGHSSLLHESKATTSP